MKEYKIFLILEEHDIETNEYKDIEIQTYETEPYKTLEEAKQKFNAI